jgi:hypothetical protein
VSEILPPTDVPSQPRAPFRLPADYYSAPVSEVRPVFDKWVPYGCGTAAIVFVLLLFIGGALAGSGGLGSLFEPIFSMMESEMTGAFAANVTPQDRTAFGAEYAQFRANVRENRIDMTKMQTFLKSVSAAQQDQKLTADEVRQLTKELHDLNTAARPSS